MVTSFSAVAALSVIVVGAVGSTAHWAGKRKQKKAKPGGDPVGPAPPGMAVLASKFCSLSPVLPVNEPGLWQPASAQPAVIIPMTFAERRIATPEDPGGRMAMHQLGHR